MALYWDEAKTAVQFIDDSFSETQESFPPGTTVIYMKEEQIDDPAYIETLRDILWLRARRCARGEARIATEKHGWPFAGQQSPFGPPSGPSESEAEDEEQAGPEPYSPCEEMFDEPLDPLFDDFLDEEDSDAFGVARMGLPRVLVNVSSCNKVVFC